jgi:menaquinol-cytochrome c reductase iron-sulfur subunit
VSAPPDPTPSAGDAPSRRSLLAAAAAGAAGLGCLAHAAAWARSLSPRVLYEPPATRRLGPPSRYPEGTTPLPDERVFLVREGARFRALSAVCTHLGCTVDRAAEGFHCPCHGSRFSADGTNLAGPAPRPLPWRPLALAGDGALVVDLAAETGPDAVLVVEGLE